MIKESFKVGILCLLVVFAIGCAQKPVTKAKNKEVNRYVFYPPLPTTPRYQYLCTISNTKDIKTKESKFAEFVLGEEADKGLPIIKPYGVKLYKSRLFVCDMKTGLFVLDLSTGKSQIWRGEAPGVLGRPVNIDIDKNGDVYIADIIRRQIIVLNKDGHFVKAYMIKKSFSPVDVAVTEKRVYASDVKNHRIYVFDKINGTVLFTIGKPGSAKGELFHPTNIKIKNGKLYVSEANNFRFQIFDLNGKFLNAYGTVGNVPGTFSRPKGIAVDNDGRIYVVDAAFENVQVFDKDFKLLIYFLNSGACKGCINLPADIEISYEIPDFFRRYVSPNFQPEYLIFITSQFGLNKVNVYAFGKYKKQR